VYQLKEQTLKRSKMMIWRAKTIWRSDEMKIENGFLSDMEKILLAMVRPISDYMIN
jgi:hypothetical protein